MNHHAWRIAVVPVLVLLFGAVFVFVLSPSGSPPALAQGGTGIVRVATSGTDVPGCGSEEDPCETIQYAADEAVEGDEVRVAAGTYSGVQQVLALGDSGVGAGLQRLQRRVGAHPAGTWHPVRNAENVQDRNPRGLVEVVFDRIVHRAQRHRALAIAAGEGHPHDHVESRLHHLVGCFP